MDCMILYMKITQSNIEKDQLISEVFGKMDLKFNNNNGDVYYINLNDVYLINYFWNIIISPWN